MNVDKLRGLMAEKRKTQQDVADLLNISPQWLRKKLIGEIDFKLEETKKLAELFNVDIKVLIYTNNEQ